MAGPVSILDDVRYPALPLTIIPLTKCWTPSPGVCLAHFAPWLLCDFALRVFRIVPASDQSLLFDGVSDITNDFLDFDAAAERFHFDPM